MLEGVSYHEQDCAGCDYIMSVLMDRPNRIVSYTHTQGDYDEYDMNWICTATDGQEYECRVEGKDRRKDKNGNNVYINTYPTAFIRENKFISMTDEKRRVPVAVCGYADGVIVWQLNMLPIDDIRKSIAEAKIRFTANGKSGKGIRNKWCSWNWVYNPARGYEWELNVNLPIENKAGIRIVRI